MAIKSAPLLAVAGAVFVLLGILLVWLIASLVKGNDRDAIATLPLEREQEINLLASGSLIVLMEMPALAGDFRDFQIEVTEKATGRTTALKYSYLGSQGQVRGLASVKMPLGTLVIDQPGDCQIRVTGLNPGKNYSGYRLIFSRPYLGRMAFQIGGIVFSGVGMLLCVIWAAWLAGWMKQSG